MAIETLGPINEVDEAFMAHFGKLLSTKSNPVNASSCSKQKSVIIQRFNKIAFKGTFMEEPSHDE